MLRHLWLGLEGEGLEGQDLSTIPMVEEGRSNEAGGSKGKGKDKGTDRNELEAQPQVKVGEAARAVANLLSQATSLRNTRAQDPKGEQGQGWYMGDGLPPVPPKLADRIGKGEYIEMCDLLPGSGSLLAVKRWCHRGWPGARVVSGHRRLMSGAVLCSLCSSGSLKVLKPGSRNDGIHDSDNKSKPGV